MEFDLRPDDGTFFVGYPTAIGAIVIGVGFLIYLVLGLPGLAPGHGLGGKKGYLLGFISILMGVDQLRRGLKRSRSSSEG